MATTIIDLDDRRRAQLGKILPPDGPTRYAVTVDADGVITLAPAVVLAAHELHLLQQRPDLVAAMKRAATDGTVPEGTRPGRR